MADPSSETLYFEGKNAKECEIFVSTVRRKALEQGKHRDNEWMAVFASSCFVGDSFYWYEDLDEDVQHDWSRLRPALVARFGRGAVNSALAPSSTTAASLLSTTMPTPAAAPPTGAPQTLVRKGRIKVLNSGGCILGYIGRSGNSWGGNTSLTMSSDDALSVSFTISSSEGPFEMQSIVTHQLPQGTDVLVIVWSHLCGGTWVNWSYPPIASCCSWSNLKSNSVWDNERKVWTIAQDGKLGVEYPRPDGGIERLQPCSNKNVNDFYWMMPSQPRTGYDCVTAVFEDVI